MFKKLRIWGCEGRLKKDGTAGVGSIEKYQEYENRNRRSCFRSPPIDIVSGRERATRNSVSCVHGGVYRGKSEFGNSPKC